jgi:putative FmdB family regulatory protein
MYVSRCGGGARAGFDPFVRARPPFPPAAEAVGFQGGTPMTYEYWCGNCTAVFEDDFPLAKNPASLPCPTCGGDSKRYLGGGTNFILKGGGWPGKANRLNSQMTENNRRAAGKMRGTWEGTQPKLVDQR